MFHILNIKNNNVTPYYIYNLLPLKKKKSMLKKLRNHSDKKNCGNTAKNSSREKRSFYRQSQYDSMSPRNHLHTIILGMS